MTDLQYLKLKSPQTKVRFRDILSEEELSKVLYFEDPYETYYNETFYNKYLQDCLEKNVRPHSIEEFYTILKCISNVHEENFSE